MNQTVNNGWTPKRIVAAVIGVIVLLAIAITVPRLVETLDSHNVMVIQSVTGELTCYTEPGPKWQGAGTVTIYPRRGTYSFDKHVVGGDGKLVEDTGKQLQFNEGGTAMLYGTVNWEMPLDCKQIIAIHRTFNSQAGVESQGVARMVNLAIQLSGSTMTSLESFAERKGELIEIINDQAQNGAYQMTTKQVERTDPVTNEKKIVSAAEIVRDKAGKPVRQQASILDQFGIHLQPMSIEKLEYSTVVQEQITTRQAATTQVQVAQAQALKAIQQAITAEKEGQADAAKAKWKQETIKAQVVTEAQQRLEVASLAAKEAEQYKREQILRGEGDSERRKLVMSADGALDQKLEAYKTVMAIWAQNFGQFKGAIVPQVQMGGNGSTNAVSSTSALIDMLSAKTAKDLALDLSNTGGKK
jgi:regulator of protease activity HflC (stomatin/prohibitin superfamily)